MARRITIKLRIFKRNLKFLITRKTSGLSAALKHDSRWVLRVVMHTVLHERQRRAMLRHRRELVSVHGHHAGQPSAVKRSKGHTGHGESEQ